MSEQIHGYVYIVTNTVNGKKYIGRHKSSTTEDGYIGSGTLLKKALRKYGYQSFVKEVLHVCYSQAELEDLEIATILEHNAVQDGMYYNLSKGIRGGGPDNLLHLAQTKRLISERMKEAHAKARAERGSYWTEAGLKTVREKLQKRLTPERRRRLAKDTELVRRLALEAKRSKADSFVRKHEKMIRQMRREGMGLTKIARALNAAGHLSPRGGMWTDQTVRQFLKRLKGIKRGLSSQVLVAPVVVHRQRMRWNKL